MDLLESSGHVARRDCALIAACMAAIGKKEACYEVRVLNDFIAKWVEEDSNGNEYVRFFHTCAPRIVSEIDKLPDSGQVYTEIYEELVLPCVVMIENEMDFMAWDLYYSSMLDLTNQYVNAKVPA